MQGDLLLLKLEPDRLLFSSLGFGSGVHSAKLVAGAALTSLAKGWDFRKVSRRKPQMSGDAR
jgi:hypothetical protein